MGNQESPINEIQIIIEQIGNDIPPGRFFEFGDNPEILERIGARLEELYHSLDSHRQFYASKPLKESNPYFDAVRITRNAQNFIKGVSKKGEADKVNTQRIRDYIHELEDIINSLKKVEDVARFSDKAQIVIDEPQNNVSDLENPSTNFPSLASHVNTAVPLSTPAYKPSESSSKKKRSRFTFVIYKLMLAPRAVGYFVFDLIGRKPSKDSSPTIMGCLVIAVIISGAVFVILIVAGFFNLSALVDHFKETWQFFHPAK